MSEKYEAIKKAASQPTIVKSNKLVKPDKTEGQGDKKVDVVQIKLTKAKILIMKTTYDNICDMMNTTGVDFQRALSVFADMGSLNYASVKAGMQERAQDAVNAIKKEVDG